MAAAAAAAVAAAAAAAAAVVSHQHSPQGDEAGRLLLLLLSSLEAGRNWLDACHHQPPYEEADDCPLWAAGGEVGDQGGPSGESEADFAQLLSHHLHLG